MRFDEENKVVVNGSKILEYLLNLSHPNGRHKAKFFMEFGFSKEMYNQLKEALIFHLKDNITSENILTKYGRKITKDCMIRTPDKRNPCIRTVWIIKEEPDLISFVTAYPIKSDK